MAYNHAKERIDLPPPQTRIEKEFKMVNNSISRVIRVLIDKQRILFSEVWDGVDHRTNTKTRGSKYKNALHTSKHIYKQTNIPDFQLCYPCKCLARYARSPITSSLAGPDRLYQTLSEERVWSSEGGCAVQDPRIPGGNAVLSGHQITTNAN